MTCPHSQNPLSPCIHAQDRRQVRHGLCGECGHDTRAIGRERLLTADDYGDPVQASIEAFVEMRLDKNP